MPRIPFVPSQGQVDLGAPMIQASPAAFGAPFQAVEQAGKQVEATALDTLRVQRALNAEQAKLDIDEKLSQLKVLHAQDEARLQDTGIPGKDYASRSKEIYDMRAKGLEGQLLYPEAVGLWRRKVATLGAETQIKAIGRGVELQHGEILGAATLTLEEKANGAVYGASVADRQRAYEEGLDIIRSLGARRVVSGPTFAGMLKQYQATIQESDATKNYQDPILRPRVRELLQTGGYNHLDPVKSATLLHTLDTRFLAEVRAADELRRRWLEENKQTAMSDLAALALDPTQPRDLLLVKLEGVRSTYGLHDTEFTRLDKLITSPERDAPSDAETLTRLTAATHTVNPTATENDLKAAFDAGKLNRKDWVNLTDKLITNQRTERNEARAILRDRQAQAEQLARGALGIPTLWEKLDQRSKLVWAQALKDITDNSTLYGGQYDPIDYVRSNLPRWSGALGVEADDRVQAVVPMLKYPTEAELDAAYQAGQIKRSDYDAQRRLFLEVRDARNRADQARQNRIFMAPAERR